MPPESAIKEMKLLISAIFCNHMIATNGLNARDSRIGQTSLDININELKETLINIG